MTVMAKEQEFLRALTDLITETRGSPQRRLRDLAAEAKRIINRKGNLDSIIRVLENLAKQGDIPATAFRIIDRYHDPNAIRML